MYQLSFFQTNDDVYTAPPNGVKYDTPQEIVAKKELIMQRVVITKTMPRTIRPI